MYSIDLAALAAIFHLFKVCLPLSRGPHCTDRGIDWSLKFDFIARQPLYNDNHEGLSGAMIYICCWTTIFFSLCFCEFWLVYLVLRKYKNAWKREVGIRLGGPGGSMGNFWRLHSGFLFFYISRTLDDCSSIILSMHTSIQHPQLHGGVLHLNFRGKEEERCNR